MIDRGLHGELVAFAAPSLETYLNRVNAPELLWQFYERNKNHAAAAKILDSLATKIGYAHILLVIYDSFAKIKIRIHFFLQIRNITLKESGIPSTSGCMYAKRSNWICSLSWNFLT